MGNITVGEIVREYLVAHGYDGLYSPGLCGCDLNDLMPCGGEFDWCQAGYKRKPTEEDGTIFGDDIEFIIGPRGNADKDK